jgi:transcriptional regulator with XRE-family HTH domain
MRIRMLASTDLCARAYAASPAFWYEARVLKIAETVKAIRNARGLTQAQFGDLFSPPVEQSTVNRWEKGSNPKPVYLAQLAGLAGMSIDELVGLAELQAREAIPLSERAAELVVRWLGYELDAGQRAINEKAPRLAPELVTVLQLLAAPERQHNSAVEAFFRERAPEAFPAAVRN